MSSFPSRKVAQYFGQSFLSVDVRRQSYVLLEEVLADCVGVGGVMCATDDSVRKLKNRLSFLDNRSLAFLLVHSGFIPDHYGDDSSEETLFSKLVEVTVAVCAERLAMSAANPTAKSSTEDVTIRSPSGRVIVCDVKSYRLGRSQGAPNVKDVIKAEDYSKWLSAYSSESASGGVVVFPSRFDFATKSDVYLYATNASVNKRILILFYEHLAYFLAGGGWSGPEFLFDLLRSYPSLFRSPSKNRSLYWQIIDPHIAMAVSDGDLGDFMATCKHILNDFVQFTIERIEKRIEKNIEEVSVRFRALEKEELLRLLVDSECRHVCDDDRRRLDSIRKFRLRL